MLNTAIKVAIKPINVSKRSTTMNYEVIPDIHTSLLDFNLDTINCHFGISIISMGYLMLKNSLNAQVIN